MNKKTIIQSVIIGAAFVGCVVVLYNGLFKGSSSTSTVALSSAPAQKALPYGDTFNYKFLDDMKDKNFEFGSVDYPKVDPVADVGKQNLSNLIQQIETNTSPAAPSKH